jgi:hypothetical protein
MSDNELELDNVALILVEDSAAATASAGAPVPEIECVAAGEQVITLRDSATGEPEKPQGVFGTQVFMKIASPDEPAPAGIDEMDLVDVATDTRIVRTFDKADREKVAWYGFRYVDSHGNPAPITTLVKAPIAA